MENSNQVVYNRAKPWQIGFFALNNTATNLYMFLFMFISYYATGIAGLLVVAVSTILTAMRIFDGITDPIIGYVIDKTKTKLGKFRPYMLIGNVILAITSVIIFKTTHLLPQGFRLLFFILIYVFYIIGYTFQTATTKSAQTVLTNDPKQRPLFTLFDAIYNTVLFIGMQMLISVVLVPKYGGFTNGLFNELLLIVIPVSLIFTVLAISSIWDKDVEANWGTGEVEKIRFRDYWPVIKRNRPLQMLIVSASTDKLANSVKGNATTTVIIYGILIANYALSGKLMLITAVPTILITMFGIQFARRLGIRKAYVVATWLSIILSLVLFAFMWLVDLTTISLSPINLTTVLYLVILSLLGGVVAIGGNIVIPMIADTSDYETYRSGQYIPGMIGTIFSFVDKLISSLATVVVGALVAMIGYTETLPQVGETATTSLFWIGMIFFIFVPILGWLASLVAMKFYKLDGEEMKRIQQDLHDRSQVNA
jgi:Na+/melibiose symporter-like transporter